MRAVLVLGFVLAVLGALPAGATAAKPLLRVDADTRFLGERIPQSFLGFSEEYSSVLRRTGIPGVPNPVTQRLFLHLARHGGGVPTYRIGGGSTDESWYRSVRREKPRGAIFPIDDEWISTMRDFQAATRAPLILGLNLGLNDPALAVEWARGAMERLPGVAHFELGNEPDYFDVRTIAGVEPAERMRRAPYTVPEYLREARRFTDALRAMRPRPSLAGPSLCCAVEWLKRVPQILRAEGKRLDLFTVHRYPMNSCGREPGEELYPRAEWLLPNDVVDGPANLFRPVVSAAKRHRLRVRVTETNSVACGGADGASNAFASALWAVDWSFMLAAIGMSGADFHSTAPLYTPYDSYYDGQVWRAGVNPLYYGLMLFSEAAGRGGRIMPSTHFTGYKRSPTHQRVWAVYDRRKREVRVVVLNKDQGLRGPAVIRVRGARGAGRLKRLTAPNVYAKASSKAIRYAGQSFAWPTDSGALEGAEQVAKVARRRGGRFRFHMPRGSAALLTVKVRRAR